MRDIEKDLELCERATEPPWIWIKNNFWGGYSGMIGKDDKEVIFADHANDGDDGAAWFEEFPSESDRDFIAAAREALPWYIEEVKRLREALEFYANEDNYDIHAEKPGLPPYAMPVLEDGGEHAKQALEV